MATEKSASIQPRTSPSEFGGNYSILFNCILIREVREAKKAKASKEVVVSLIDELKALKAEYEKLAGEPWPKQEKRKGAGEKSSEIIIPPEELLKKKLKRSQEYQTFMMKRLRKAKFDQRLFEKEMLAELNL